MLVLFIKLSLSIHRFHIAPILLLPSPYLTLLLQPRVSYNQVISIPNSAVCKPVSRCGVPDIDELNGAWPMFQGMRSRTGQTIASGPKTCHLAFRTFLGSPITGSPIIGPKGRTFVGGYLGTYCNERDCRRSAKKFSNLTRKLICAPSTLSFSLYSFPFPSPCSISLLRFLLTP